MNFFEDSLSSADVGSSAKNNFGLPSRARQTATLCCCPILRFEVFFAKIFSSSPKDSKSRFTHP